MIKAFVTHLNNYSFYKVKMIDPIKEYCRKKGYANHVVKGGLKYLVTNWERTVASITNGYSFGLDDYLNDMDGRKILNEVLDIATDEQKNLIEARIKIADESFFSLTSLSPRCIWGELNELKYGYSRDKDWWYYRIPIKLPERSIEEFKDI
jgi:hypothetical protein